MSQDVLVLFYSVHGATRELADWIAEGISRVPGAAPRVRTVPKVAAVTTEIASAVPPSGAPYVQAADLAECAGLALGSPTRFGNMAAPMKYFWDSTVAEWSQGTLAGKPACVFTSSSSMHGGQESTLLSMMLPLFHHGMLVMGLPFTESTLSSTMSGGTPYGASHVAGTGAARGISADEKTLAIAQGKRLAEVALKLR
jgi:NAD(P)H dehydrogenase (quinone)